MDLRWEQHDREYYGTSEQGTKYDHARPKSRDSGTKSRTNSKDSAQRDNEEWVGVGDRAERKAQDRIAQEKIALAANQKAEQSKLTTSANAPNHQTARGTVRP